MGSGGLVGRGPVLAALHAAIDRALTGGGGAVLLRGDAGMGKTALVQHTTALVRMRGAALAWGTCWDGGGAPAFWPWIQLLRAVPDDRGIRDALAELASASDQPIGLFEDPMTRFRAFDRVAASLRTVAVRGPLILVIEDLHWADMSSLRLLTFVIRHVADVPLLVLGTTRIHDNPDTDDPRQDLLAELAAGSELLELIGLSTPEVGALLEEVVGQRPPEGVIELVNARTGGNPFFVTQLGRLLAGESGPWERRPALTAVPSGVAEVLVRRLAILPGPLQELLGAASVVGSAFGMAAAAELSGTQLPWATDLVDRGVRAGVLTRTDAGHARFAHDLFREVAYAELSGARRAALHLALAERLERESSKGSLGAATAIAYHRSAALPLGDSDLAVAALEVAAREAGAQRAFDEQERLLARAVEVVGGAWAADPELLLGLADASRRAGHRRAALTTYTVAAQRADAAGNIGVRSRAAFGAHRVGRATDVGRADVIALLEGALSDPAARPDDRCLLLAAMARELADGPDRDRVRASRLATEAVALAERIGEPRALGYAIFAATDVRWEPGAARERLVLADRLVAAAEEAGELELELEGRLVRLVALLELGDPLFEVAVKQFVGVADASGIPHYVYMARSREATLACVHGSLTLADQLMERAAEYGLWVEEPDTWGVQASQLVGLAVLRHDWTRISAFAQRTGRPLVPPEFESTARAWVAIESDNRTGAAAILEAVVDPPALSYRWRSLTRLTMEAELAAALKNEARAAALYDALLPHREDWAVIASAVFTTGPVALQLGLLASLLHRWDEAIELLEAAVQACDRLGARPYAVRARAALADALSARGLAEDEPVGTQLRAEAGQLADQVGLPWPDPDQRGQASENSFTRVGEVWFLTYAGRRVAVRDAKGLRDLAVLLAAPGRDVPAAELIGAAVGRTDAAGGSDPVLDERAKGEYRRRLAQLEAELDEADMLDDRAGSERATVERRALLEELRRATGLRGRPRRLGDQRERARTTVTARIRSSIRHIEQAHPELGRHLAASVLTGSQCSYRPVEPVTWQVSVTP